ncbi:hypothetical protein AAG906_003400 [Vitis piasezkii]
MVSRIGSDLTLHFLRHRYRHWHRRFRKSTNHVSEVELGRATWTFLHTLAAQVDARWGNHLNVLYNSLWYCIKHKPEWRVDARWSKLKCELRACYLQGTPDFGEG